VLVQSIGVGGFGHVYRATHKLARAEVAVKVIKDEIRENVKARRQFLKEARALMRIQSRHAVAVHDVDEDESGRIFVAMELLRGQNLEEHMRIVAPETRRLTWDETARIVIQICDALEEAHDQGIVHRDLKPGNVMMVPGRGGKIQAKVVDFGIASLAQAGDSDLTSIDNIPRVIGTPSFMSPEQARGLSVSPRSDLYSLGAMMYRMVCGCKPFEAKTDQGMLIAHVMEQPVSIRQKFPELDVPAAFDELVLRMMRKNPDERPADASEVADALKGMLPREDAARQGGAGGGRRTWMIVGIVAGVLVAVAAAGAVLLTMDRGQVAAVTADAVAPGAAPSATAAAVEPQPGVVQPVQAQPGQAQPVQYQPVGSGLATGQAVPVRSAGVQPSAGQAPVGQPVMAQPGVVRTAAGSTPAGSTSAPVNTAHPASAAASPSAGGAAAAPSGVQSRKGGTTPSGASVPASPAQPATGAAAGNAASQPGAQPAAQPAANRTPPPRVLESSTVNNNDVRLLDSMGPSGGSGQTRGNRSATAKPAGAHPDDDDDGDANPTRDRANTRSGGAFDELNF